MKISRKTLFAGTLPALAFLACFAFSGSARAAVIVIGGSAGSANGMTVCDCTQAPSGCGCVVNTGGGGGHAPEQP
jgi:hypothetical protein